MQTVVFALSFWDTKIMNVLVVGSSVIDLFLSVEKSHTIISGNNVSFALGDKIPSDIKKLGLGGNGANVSVGLTRLGIPTTFYTYLGKDILSREIEEKLSAEGVELISDKENGENSPLHIIFDFETDRVIFSHYPKIEHKFKMDNSGFDYIYLNSVADVWEGAYEKVLEFSETNNIPIIFSPGSRQLDNLNDLIFKIIQKSKFIFINKEEAVKILKEKNIQTPDIKSILSGLSSLGPKIVSVTDGPSGAYAMNENKEMFQINASEKSSSVDKTGAGDGYASGFLGASLLEKPVNEAMRWGAINASSVMKYFGSQPGLLSLKALEEELAKHSDHKANKI